MYNNIKRLKNAIAVQLAIQLYKFFCLYYYFYVQARMVSSTFDATANIRNASQNQQYKLIFQEKLPLHISNKSISINNIPHACRSIIGNMKLTHALCASSGWKDGCCNMCLSNKSLGPLPILNISSSFACFYSVHRMRIKYAICGLLEKSAAASLLLCL